MHPATHATGLRLLLVMLVVALASFAVAPLAFDRGPEGLDAALAAQEGQETEVPAEDEVNPSDVLQLLPVEATQVFLTRDPFRPVRAEEPDGGTDNDAGGDGTGGTTGPEPEPTTTPGAGVEVVGVFESDSGQPMAIISFEGVLYTEGVGGTFADDQFAVTAIDLDTGCVTMSDSGEAFTACVGDGEVGGGETPEGGCSTGTSSASCEGIDVRLVDVTTDDGERALVSVDGTVYEVAEGEVFASSFQVISIDAPCVRLLYGDDGFTLCVGDQALK